MKVYLTLAYRPEGGVSLERSYIKMKNNIIKKNAPVESTGIGLQSINARYRMLEKQGISIEQSEHEFSVIIPLID